MIKIKEATGLILWYMRYFKFAGWTSLWDTIYVAPGYLYNNRILKHERKHIDQMQRDGKLVYMAKYMYYLITVGYYDNPYEIEARAAENV